MLPREGVTYLVGMAGYVEGQPVVFIRDFNNWFDAEAFDRIIPACDAHRAK
jgi:inosine-uridine nucleoside N-ribohydrolase